MNMNLISESDRKHIENKYHKVGEDFDSLGQQQYCVLQ